MLIELTLFLALTQQPPPQSAPTLPSGHQVALTLHDGRTRLTMDLDHAERLYALLERQKGRRRLSEEERRFHAALTLALGTLQDASRLTAPLLGTRERMDWEVRRGVRRPVQRAGRQ
jgi:hypothetical protein